MPNEYDAASAKPRRREMPAPVSAAPGPAAALDPANAMLELPVLAWPTMIDETIGNMGNTHGVNDSSRPAMKKAPTIGQNEPLRSTASTPDADSPVVAFVAEGDAVAAAAVAPWRPRWPSWS